jgi:DNA-binding MarR family transcriptional regulator
MSLKKLSARVSLAHSTVSGIVDRLEKRGFVNRQVLESDRRVTQITVSKHVSEFMKRQAPELALHPLLKALRRASEAERSAVRKGIETLERLLEE